MAEVDIAEDLVPIGEFKTHASQLLRRLHETGRPLVITQNGRASWRLVRGSIEPTQSEA